MPGKPLPIGGRPATPWLDRMGMASGTLCAVHCAATALLMGTLSAIGASGLADERVEMTFIMLTVTLGALSLGHSRRRHRSLRPTVWFAAGMVLLLMVRGYAHHPLAEMVVVAAGAACVVRAHWQNARMLVA